MSTPGTGWAAQPEHSDAVARESTGHGWDEWVALIDAGPGRDAGHTAIAAWVHDVHGVPGWWAQNVTVSYERITGLRRPGQMADGTFTANRSRLLARDPEELRASLLDDAQRATLLPRPALVLRSRPTTRSPRFALDDGTTVVFSLDPTTSGRVRVSIAHEKLPTSEDVERWKTFWGAWLTTL